MYNGKVKILSCKIKLLKRTYMYINHSRGVDYVIQCRSDDNKYKYKYMYGKPKDLSFNKTCTYKCNTEVRSCKHFCSGKQQILRSMCVCSLRYPACNAHTPYCQLWPVRFYNIFPRYLINGTIFEKKKKLLNIKYVLCFLFYNFCLQLFSF